MICCIQHFSLQWTTKIIVPLKQNKKNKLTYVQNIRSHIFSLFAPLKHIQISKNLPMVISHLYIYIYSVCVSRISRYQNKQNVLINFFFFFRENSLIKGPFLTEKGEAEVSGTLQKNSQILQRIQREIKEFTTTYPFLIYEIWQKNLEIIYM